MKKFIKQFFVLLLINISAQIVYAAGTYDLHSAGVTADPILKALYAMAYQSASTDTSLNSSLLDARINAIKNFLQTETLKKEDFSQKINNHVVDSATKLDSIHQALQDILKKSGSQHPELIWNLLNKIAPHNAAKPIILSPKDMVLASGFRHIINSLSKGGEAVGENYWKFKINLSGTPLATYFKDPTNVTLEEVNNKYEELHIKLQLSNTKNPSLEDAKLIDHLALFHNGLAHYTKMFLESKYCENATITENDLNHSIEIEKETLKPMSYEHNSNPTSKAAAYNNKSGKKEIVY